MDSTPKGISAETFERLVGFQISNFLPEHLSHFDVENIEVKFTPVVNLMERKCLHAHSDGADAKCHQRTCYFGVHEIGEVIVAPPPEYKPYNPDPHFRTEKREGAALGVAWRWLFDDLKCVVEYRSNVTEWKEAQETVYEFTITLHILQQKDKDRVAQIRRRTEDALRKSDPTTILRVAEILGVNLG